MKKILNHKKYIIVSLLLLCLSVGVTYAVYLANAGGLTNKLNLQEVSTKIHEEKPTIDGNIINKSPQIVNTTKNGTAIVRVKLAVSTESQYTPITIGYSNDNNIKINSDWVDGEDGYYYYTKVLDNERPSNVTSPIFDKVTGVVNTKEDGKHYYNDGYGPFDVTIYQESVQSKIGEIDMSKVSSDRFVDQAKQLFDYYKAK